MTSDENNPLLYSLFQNVTPEGVSITAVAALEKTRQRAAPARQVGLEIAVIPRQHDMSKGKIHLQGRLMAVRGQSAHLSTDGLRSESQRDNKRLPTRYKIR